MSRGYVAIGYCHTGILHEPMVRSMYNFLFYDMRRRRVVTNGGGICTASSPYIPDARNVVVEQFLEKPELEWLWFLDHDMVFPADALYQLMDQADPVERPIVGALYFANLTYMVRDQQGHLGEPLDIQAPVFLTKEFKPLDRFEIPGLYELGATGMGCTLIHRRVLEDMAAAYDPPWRWFGHDHDMGKMAGEDVTFCRRAAKLGFSTWGYTGFPVEHIKSHRLNLKTFTEFHKIELEDA